MNTNQQPVQLSTVGLLEAVRLLADAAVELGDDSVVRARELETRLASGQFRLAFCGGFSNGKSTLINALIGAEVLPVGVLPVTAIPTEIISGPTATACIELTDGTAAPCALGDIADWVSEAGNPDNRKGVHRVVVTAPSPLLEPGVTIVDTPGLESIFEHNDATALAAIRDAEGAVVVLSADAPLTAAERRLLDVVADRSAATFFVLNRIDHLTVDELGDAVEFVTREIAEATGTAQPLFAVSARNALTAVTGHQPHALAATGLPVLRSALEHFVNDDLVIARLDAFARAVGRLADNIEASDAIELAMVDLTGAEIAERITRFDLAATEQRQALDDDRHLLDAAVAQVNLDLAEWLATEGRWVPPGADDRLAALSSEGPLRRLEARLDDEIRGIVEERFDLLRPLAATRVDQEWAQAAGIFTTRVQRRVDAIRDAASAEFGTRLRPLPIPAIADEPDRFWYLFYRPELPDAPIWRALRLLLPHQLVRTRLLRSAKRNLRQELDKHSGRARSDLARRLDDTHRRFVVELVSFVGSVTAELRNAATRAETTRELIGRQRSTLTARHDRIRHAVEAARAATGR